jgi:streptomycin 6-kinase
MQIPDRLNWLRQHAAGAIWLDQLPGIVAALAEAWELALETPYEGANVSYVAPAIRGAERVVLKVQWPDPESMHEADALKVWDGAGAIRLLAHDPQRHALLLERCVPGTCLADARDVDRLGVLIAMLPRLWKLAGAPFRSLAEEAREWRATLRADWEACGKPCERRLVDAAAEFIAELVDDQGDQVLLHQDLHGENVLAAEREPWLVIDPKPLAGEREFSLAPIIRSAELGHSRADVFHRLDRLSAELGLDRRRACRWAIAQTVAWSFDGSDARRHYETARWLLGAA